MTQGWILAEKLVAAIGRAFYNDSVVVVLDALVLEKYIIEEEIGPRLKLPNKEVRKVLNQLEVEGLIKFEHVNNVEDLKSSFKCYYIDYQSFVDIIRYRVFLMQQMIKKEQSNELSEVYYECPTCSGRYTSLEVQRLVSGDYKFVCSNCCPFENFRSILKTDDYYRLKEIDNRKAVSTLQQLHKKMDHQLQGEAKVREGIYDLLYQLRDEQVTTNLPSENIKKGHRNNDMLDEEARAGIQYNLEHAKYGGSYLRKKNLEMIKEKFGKTNDSNGTAGLSGFLGRQLGIQINLLGEGEEWKSGTGSNGMNSNLTGGIPGRDTSLPEFLHHSRVANAEKVYGAVQSIQSNRENSSMMAGNTMMMGEYEVAQEQALKRRKIDAEELDNAILGVAPTSSPSKGMVAVKAELMEDDDVPPPPPPEDDEEGEGEQGEEEDDDDDFDNIAWEDS